MGESLSASFARSIASDTSRKPTRIVPLVWLSSFTRHGEAPTNQFCDGTVAHTVGLAGVNDVAVPGDPAWQSAFTHAH